MQRLLFHLRTCKDIRVVYLHVESTNSAGIAFYEHVGFHFFTVVPGYYYSDGINADGLVYVQYMNGGEPYMGGPRNWHKSRLLKQCSRIEVDNLCNPSFLNFKRQNSA